MSVQTETKIVDKNVQIVSTKYISFFKKEIKPKKMTIVSLSTNKKLGTTEILVKPPEGRQQVYRAKLSDIQKEGLTPKLLKKSVVSEVNNVAKLQLSRDKTKEEHLSNSLSLCLNDSFAETETLPNDKIIIQNLLAAGLTELKYFEIGLTKHFVCPISNCLRLFLDLNTLKYHLVKECHVRPFKCKFPNCTWSFASGSKLDKHKATHEEKHFTCNINGCGKKFLTSFNVKQHVNFFHEKKFQFPCSEPDCLQTFHTQRSLDLHSASHANVSPAYKCNFENCGKSFITKNALCSHLRSHEHNPQDLKCKWEGCDKTFQVPCRLREHMRTHTREKPFVCTYEKCAWKFMTKSKLKRHIQTHTQERKFPCTVEGCNKSFLRSQHLQDHMQTHSKEKDLFCCPVENCSALFSHRSSVNIHRKNAHGNSDSTNETVDQVKCVFMESADSPLDHVNPASSALQVESITLLAGEEEGASFLLTDFSFPEQYLVAGAEKPAESEFAVKVKKKSDIKKGSARTCLTCSDIIGEKHYKRQYDVSVDNKIINSVPPDIPLASNFMDELYSHEELPILLLESNNSRHPEFEASTINLRDLE